MLALELGLLAIIAGGLGLVLGYVIAGALLPGVAATLRGLYGAPASGTLDFDPLWVLGGLAIALAGTAIAAASGLWSVARMPLLASAQPRAWARVSAARLRLQAIAGATLLALGLAAPLLFDGLLAGFALLGGLLMGAALCLPAALAALLGLAARRAATPTSEWFWSDTAQQLRGLSLALMALLLALATNIGVGTMVGSFRLTFEGWLDQRMASELYVTARSEDEAARLRGWLATRSDAVLPIWSVDQEILSAPAEIYGVADHATYRDHWPAIRGGPEMWDQVHGAGAALVNEQLFRRNDLEIGQTVELAPGWSAPIAGVYSDYGNPAGQVVVANAELEARFPDLPRLRYGIRIAPDAAPDLTRTLTTEFGLNPAQIIDQSAIKAVSLRVFEQTFAVTGALNVLTLSVAGFAILTALLTLASLRLPQLAPVWALGLTRRTLARLELGRAMLLALLTFVLALPVGLALAWALLAVVNVEAFGWRLPLRLFPGQWMWLLLAAVAAAALASALPAWRLRSTPPAAFLKVFAHER